MVPTDGGKPSPRPPRPSRVDLTVLARTGAQAMDRGQTVLDPRLLEADCAALAVGREQWFAALKVLQANGLLTVAWVAPSLVTHVELTAKGLDRALARARPDMAEVRARLLAELGRRRPGAVVRLDQALAEPPLLIDVLLDRLQAEGLVDCTRVPGGGVRIGAVAGLSTPGQRRGGAVNPKASARSW